MLEIAYTAPDYFGVFGASGEITTIWLVPTREDVLLVIWYASQGIEQLNEYQQTILDLLMQGF